MLVQTQRMVRKNGKLFKVNFDEYGEIDTVTSCSNRSTQLVSTNKDAQFFIKHADAIHARKPVNNVEYL